MSGILCGVRTVRLVHWFPPLALAGGAGPVSDGVDCSTGDAAAS